MTWEELHGLHSISHFPRQSSNPPWATLATAFVATTQRPTLMKCAFRAAVELDYAQETQPHQVCLLRPFLLTH